MIVSDASGMPSALRPIYVKRITRRSCFSNVEKSDTSSLCTFLLAGFRAVSGVGNTEVGISAPYAI